MSKKKSNKIKRKPKAKKKTAFSKESSLSAPEPQDVPIGMPMGMQDLKKLKEEATKMDAPQETESPAEDGTQESEETSED